MRSDRRSDRLSDPTAPIVTERPFERWIFAGLAVVTSTASVAWMWNFTVDDALISLRYAQHLADGHGYRFNASGAPTDGVTPLPWPLLMAPFAHGDVLGALFAAKIFGAVAYVTSVAFVGSVLPTLLTPSRRSRVLLALGIVILALAFPVAAWAASGMETGLATALATMAACLLVRNGASPWPSIVAGSVTALRPELLPWALAIAVGSAGLMAHARAPSRAFAFALVTRLAFASIPFALCTLVRLVVFGRPTPLALLAKPSDASHGVVYAVAAVVVVLLPIAVASSHLLRRGAGVARVVMVSFIVHVLTVIAVGGDWMPYARLVVPVVPSLLIVVATVIARDARGVASTLRLMLAAALGGWLLFRAAPAGRRVGVDREALILAARPVLREAETVAALDVGWLSAATSAKVVDLAGLTDPTIAVLPGGHTSKRVSTAMLLERGVDTVLVYSEARVVEERIVHSELFGESFREVARLPLGARAFYRVYRRSPR